MLCKPNESQLKTNQTNLGKKKYFRKLWPTTETESKLLNSERKERKKNKNPKGKCGINL